MIAGELITTGEAARILRVAEDTVRRFVEAGVLRATRTQSGLRIFDRSDVEKLASNRANQRTGE